MQSPRYALVAYVKNAVGEFIENLRRELHPDLPHLPAHVTILPPRSLQGTELAALEMLDEVCSRIEPFEITLGQAETFLPVTPTVFIGFAHGAQRLHELHELLNAQVLRSAEEWPYIPHLTIAKLRTDALAQAAFATSHDRWAKFHGSHRIRIQELTFVREREADLWVDLAGVPLGRSLVNH